MTDQNPTPQSDAPDDLKGLIPKGGLLARVNLQMRQLAPLLSDDYFVDPPSLYSSIHGAIEICTNTGDTPSSKWGQISPKMMASITKQDGAFNQLSTLKTSVVNLTLADPENFPPLEAGDHDEKIIALVNAETFDMEAYNQAIEAKKEHERKKLEIYEKTLALTSEFFQLTGNVVGAIINKSDNPQFDKKHRLLVCHPVNHTSPDGNILQTDASVSDAFFAFAVKKGLVTEAQLYENNVRLGTHDFGIEKQLVSMGVKTAEESVFYDALQARAAIDKKEAAFRETMAEQGLSPNVPPHNKPAGANTTPSAIKQNSGNKS